MSYYSTFGDKRRDAFRIESCARGFVDCKILTTIKGNMQRAAAVSWSTSVNLDVYTSTKFFVYTVSWLPLAYYLTSSERGSDFKIPLTRISLETLDGQKDEATSDANYLQPEYIYVEYQGKTEKLNIYNTERTICGLSFPQPVIVWFKSRIKDNSHKVNVVGIFNVFG